MYSSRILFLIAISSLQVPQWLCLSLVADDPPSLRVMTFNTWLSGAKVENGLEKIAKHIALLQPDIVALQVCFNSPHSMQTH